MLITLAYHIYNIFLVNCSTDIKAARYTSRKRVRVGTVDEDGSSAPGTVRGTVKSRRTTSRAQPSGQPSKNTTDCTFPYFSEYPSQFFNHILTLSTSHTYMVMYINDLCSGVFTRNRIPNPVDK